MKCIFYSVNNSIKGRLRDELKEKKKNLSTGGNNDHV